eukprot:scaffold416115_cov17-Prasinocladus_malaysianus.AAC.1
MQQIIAQLQYVLAELDLCKQLKTDRSTGTVFRGCGKFETGCCYTPCTADCYSAMGVGTSKLEDIRN